MALVRVNGALIGGRLEDALVALHHLVVRGVKLGQKAVRIGAIVSGVLLKEGLIEKALLGQSTVTFLASEGGINTSCGS